MTLFPEVNFNQEPKHFKVVRVMNVREKMVYFGMGLVNFMLNFLPDSCFSSRNFGLKISFS